MQPPHCVVRVCIGGNSSDVLARSRDKEGIRSSIDAKGKQEEYNNGGEVQQNENVGERCVVVEEAAEERGEGVLTETNAVATEKAAVDGGGKDGGEENGEKVEKEDVEENED